MTCATSSLVRLPGEGEDERQALPLAFWRMPFLMSAKPASSSSFRASDGVERVVARAGTVASGRAD